MKSTMVTLKSFEHNETRRTADLRSGMKDMGWSKDLAIVFQSVNGSPANVMPISSEDAAMEFFSIHNYSEVPKR